MELNKVYLGDSLETIKTFKNESIDCVVTSPPYYGLRDYGMDGQIGLEETPGAYIQRLVELFREIRRVLKDDGTIWVNIGDSYYGGGKTSSISDNGSGEKQKSNKGAVSRENLPNNRRKSDTYKPKDLIGIPWMLAFALRADGWYLRQDIIWHKPNPMPESVTDRCTKSHEYIFLLSKSEKYYFDHEAIQEEAVTQIDPRIGRREEYNGIRQRQEGTGNRAFVSLKTRPRFGGTKYGDNDDPHYKTKSGKEWEPQMRTKNCQYDGQRPNTMHIKRELGESDENYVVRNKRDVWSVPVRPNKEAHFATYPEMLIQPCILAGCPENGVVLDPFMGSGTTGIVARKLNRNYIGCELNPEYQRMAERRILEHGENLFNQ